MSDARLLNWPDRTPGMFFDSLRRGSVLFALATLGAVACIVAIRRAAGALTSPLEPPVLLAIGAVLAVVAMVIRITWLRASTERMGPWPNRIVMLLTSLAVLLLGTMLCVPNTVGWAKILLLVLLAVEEGWGWEWYLSRHTGLSRPQRNKCAADVIPQHITPAEYEAEPDQEVIQQLTRSQAADGTESLTGWLRMPLAAGQRTGSLHVAFCPPLATTPELEVEQIDGPEARIKTAQLLPYGARLDLKLAAAAEEPTSVLLQFAARTTFS